MSSKLFGAFRETLKVGDDQPLMEPVEGGVASDRPSSTDADATEKPSQVKRCKKRRRYQLAPN